MVLLTQEPELSKSSAFVVLGHQTHGKPSACELVRQSEQFVMAERLAQDNGGGFGVVHDAPWYCGRQTHVQFTQLPLPPQNVPLLKQGGILHEAPP